MNPKKLIKKFILISFIAVSASLFIAVPQVLAAGGSAYGPYQPEPTGFAGLDSLFLISAGLYVTGTGMIASASKLINKLGVLK